VAREISTATNFNGRAIQSEQELLEFATNAGFPSHGLILRPAKTDFSEIYKGITHIETLTKCYAQLRQSHETVYAETDMRALYNPTRMGVIAQAAKNLVAKIQSTCPDCQLPGFDVAHIKKGLPCGLCGLPTAFVKSYVYRCQRCGCEKEELFPHQKEVEDPMYCGFCNP
jgi:hypothetical protein